MRRRAGRGKFVEKDERGGVLWRVLSPAVEDMLLYVLYIAEVLLGGW